MTQIWTLYRTHKKEEIKLKSTLNYVIHTVLCVTFRVKFYLNKDSYRVKESFTILFLSYFGESIGIYFSGYH